MQLLRPDATGLSRAAAALRDGGLAAFPTETVYGLGADARDDRAVAKVFAAKGRPSFNPLIVHTPHFTTAQTYVTFSADAARLAARFWPGALTLVLPLRHGAGISPLVTAGLDTLAVRVPDHPVGQGLLRAFGGPVAAPSANPSGRVSPTTAQHVVDGLGERVDVVVDGGPCAVGLESTIVACLDRPVLLRAGGVPAEAIEAVLDHAIDRHEDAETPLAPGQLQSHYAPKGLVRLNADAPMADEVFVGFGPGPADLNLSAAGDLTEAAANLFAILHQLDAMEAARIAFAPVPTHGLGQAINDRLRRAAAPRDQ